MAEFIVTPEFLANPLTTALLSRTDELVAQRAVFVESLSGQPDQQEDVQMLANLAMFDHFLVSVERDIDAQYVALIGQQIKENPTPTMDTGVVRMQAVSVVMEGLSILDRVLPVPRPGGRDAVYHHGQHVVLSRDLEAAVEDIFASDPGRQRRRDAVMKPAAKPPRKDL